MPPRPRRSAADPARIPTRRGSNRRTRTAVIVTSTVVGGLLAAVLLTALTGAGGAGAPMVRGAGTSTAVQRPGGSGAAGTASAGPTAAPTTAAPPVLQLPGAFPTSGPGTFRYAVAAGPVLGAAGDVRRFRVGVETGVDEDPAQVAAIIEETLGDQRSWIGGGTLRLQRVGAGEPYHFTIYLATGETARRMCAEGGLDIRVGGAAYTSCRVGPRVVINLSRWRRSVPEFVAQGVPLDTYRQYVINHEVGHYLGHHHERCPAAGEPAPTMQTQTLGLRGCRANPWPYPHGRRYAGPPA